MRLGLELIHVLSGYKSSIPETAFYILKDYPSYLQNPFSRRTDCKIGKEKSIPTTFHGILQARLLEWVAISFSGVFSQPRDWTRVSRIAGRFFTNWATREALSNNRERF